MILLINICKEKMHEFEFVKPIEDIVKAQGKKYKIIALKKLESRDIEGAEKIIICGTSLLDFEYLNYKEKFGFLKSVRVPVFGICGGMQSIASVFGGKLKKGKEIGLVKIKFAKEFFGMNGETEAYAMHNLSLKEDRQLKKIIDIIAISNKGFIHVFKVRSKEIYGCLFHPEVRHGEIIERFLEGP